MCGSSFGGGSLGSRFGFRFGFLTRPPTKIIIVSWGVIDGFNLRGRVVGFRGFASAPGFGLILGLVLFGLQTQRLLVDGHEVDEVVRLVREHGEEGSSGKHPHTAFLFGVGPTLDRGGVQPVLARRFGGQNGQQLVFSQPKKILIRRSFENQVQPL